VAEQFPPELRATVLSALDEYPGDDAPAGRARVHLAILKIAGGDLEKVRRYAAHANTDFRDILYMADHDRPDGSANR
jgi:hypothetical protein